MNAIGINTLLFTSPFTNQSVTWFEKFSLWGFDTVEIAAEDPLSLDASIIREALGKYHLKCATVCAILSTDRDLRGNDAQQKEGVAYLKAVIDFTEKIGAEMVIGPLYSSVGRADAVPPNEYKAQEKLVVAHLKTLCDYAAEKNVKLAIEPLNRFETDFINTCDQGLKLISLVDKPNLFIHLDTFHMNIEEKKLDDAIRKAGSKLALLHTCGSDRGTPGKDHTDWEGIRKALKDINYQGQFVIESFSTEIKIIAKAASIWRNIEASSEEIAIEGLAF